jgi:hypothetical protein
VTDTGDEAPRADACSGERRDAGGVRRLEAACSGGSRLRALADRGGPVPADRGSAAQCVWRESEREKRLDRGKRFRVFFRDVGPIGIWLWALVHSPIQILKFSWPIHA